MVSLPWCVCCGVSLHFALSLPLSLSPPLSPSLSPSLPPSLPPSLSLSAYLAPHLISSYPPSPRNTQEDSEIDYLFQDGTAAGHNPDAWEEYVNHIADSCSTEEQRQFDTTHLLAAYRRRLMSGDPEVRMAAARAFITWEMKISKVFVSAAA